MTLARRVRTPRLLMIDNVDSFTFMLVDYLVSLGATVAVERSDAITAGQLLGGGFDGAVISPGPGHPQAAGGSVALAAACIEARLPLLGVCLGHQAIALACGGTVERVAPVHGKVAQVRHDGTGLFAALPSPIGATRYHSLAVASVPSALRPNAWSEDGVVMGLRHRHAPAHGVQFHPESVASEGGRVLLAAFLDDARIAA